MACACFSRATVCFMIVATGRRRATILAISKAYYPLLVLDYNVAYVSVICFHHQRLIGTEGIEEKGFVQPGLVPVYKFKHNLFEKLEQGEMLTDEEKDLFTSWPRSNDAVARALDNLCEEEPAKYRLCVLPAYDMHAALIEPGWYTNRLENSLAEIRFTLSHWAISAKGANGAANSYRANIVDIMVLCPPPPTIITPRKRKIAIHHPAAPTTKKREVRKETS